MRSPWAATPLGMSVPVPATPSRAMPAVEGANAWSTDRLGAGGACAPAAGSAPPSRTAAAAASHARRSARRVVQAREFTVGLGIGVVELAVAAFVLGEGAARELAPRPPLVARAAEALEQARDALGVLRLERPAQPLGERARRFQARELVRMRDAEHERQVEALELAL